MKKQTYIGVYALIKNSDKILFIKKARGPYTGQWDLPGGGLDFGETPLDGLHREVLEETGLKIKSATLLNVLTHKTIYKQNNEEDRDFYHIGIIYNVTTEDNLNNLKTKPDGQDSAGASWISKEKIDHSTLSPFAKNIYETI